MPTSSLEENVYPLGAKVRLYGSFTTQPDPDTPPQLTDPTACRCIVRHEDAVAETVYEWNEPGSGVVRIAQGRFYKDVIGDPSERWHYRYEGEGAVETAGDRSFYVMKSEVLQR